MTEPLPHHLPFILPYEGTVPALAEPPVCGHGVSILGRVTLGRGAVLARLVVLRADGHFVTIGDDFVAGARTTVHIAHEIYPAIIGHRVTAGHNTCIHACTVGDDCVIEDDVVILDGSVVENGVVIEKGSTVFPRSELKAGLLYAGSPAKEVRALTSEDRAERAAAVTASVRAAFAEPVPEVPPYPAHGDDVFIGGTVRLVGRIELGPRTSTFFSNEFDAGPGRITVGANTNLQDNSRIICTGEGVTIGADTTLGHNVVMADCTVGDRSLIGIGATVTAGTRIDGDVLLAAGAVTEPGQHLEGGWLWGGRPARPLSRLNDKRREMIMRIVKHYGDYGAAYRAEQEALKAKSA